MLRDGAARSGADILSNKATFFHFVGRVGIKKKKKCRLIHFRFILEKIYLPWRETSQLGKKKKKLLKEYKRQRLSFHSVIHEPIHHTIPDCIPRSSPGRGTGDPETNTACPSSGDVENITRETLIILHTNSCELMDKHWIQC